MVKFFAPEVAYADARKYLPALLEKREVQGGAALKVLDSLETVVQSIDVELYQGTSLADSVRSRGQLWEIDSLRVWKIKAGVAPSRCE